MDQPTQQVKPSTAEETILKRLNEEWIDSLTQRSTTYRHLADRSLVTFWQDSRDAFNSYVPAPDTVEQEWKARHFKPKTRNKVVASVAALVASGVGLDFSAVDSEESVDRELSKVSEDVYDWSLERENFDAKQIRILLESCGTGTCFLMEEIAWDKRDVKEISDIDFSTGEIKFQKKERVDFKGCRGNVVPVDEVYPGDIWSPTVEEQPYLFRRLITSHQEAEKSLTKYPSFKNVPIGRKYFFENFNVIDSKESQDDSDDSDIEILYYWNPNLDEYHIIANGVLLTQIDNPIPYPHKRIPFAKCVLYPFADTRFFYGNSAPNQMKDEQALVNDFWRMIIDAEKLKIKPPLFTNSAELAQTDVMIPGSISPKEPDETIETVKEVTQGASQSAFNILTLAEQQMDESSVDPLVSGTTPQGDPTATEVRAVVNSSERLRGLTENFFGDFLLQHAHLRLPNLLWFLSNDEEYKQVIRDDVKIGDEKGKRKIIFASAVEIPESQDILKAELTSKKKGTPTEFVFVDKESVNDYRFHVSIAATPKPRKSSQTRLVRTVQQYMLLAQNPVIDQKENATDLLEAMGKDPQRYLSEASMPQGAPPGNGNALAATLSQNPMTLGA